VILTDIGVNLLHPQFDADRDAVIARARTAGVSRMLVTATNLDEAAAAITLCQRHGPGLWCTAGIHPHDAAAAEDVAFAEDVATAEDVAAADDWKTRLTQLCEHPKVKAVGETGLDFFRNLSPPDIQIEVFRAQLAIAADAGKPVFVHDRDSAGAVGQILSERRESLLGVVVHCFTGSRDDLLGYLDAGYHIGITGWVCDRRRGAGLRELIPLIPLDRLLIETDAPFLRPHNAPQSTSMPRRNEPALLGCVTGQLAEIYECTPQQVAAASHDNAERLFQLTD
jgi:TatD DNase family protein